MSYHVPGRRPVERLRSVLEDDNLEEVMCIGPNKPWMVYHREMGMLETDFVLDERGIDEVLDWILRMVKKEEYSGPMIDGMLPEGGRVNVVLPPVAIGGPYITIRLFPRRPIVITDLIRWGTLTAEVAAFLWVVIEGFDFKPANIIVSGGSGTGKTTLLNTLTYFIPPDKRIITIEDTAELMLPHPHWVRMEVPLGSGLTMDDLLKNSLRMRPDRLIIGEVRGEEARTLFTAMNVGHEGCLGTLHANSTMETITRIISPPMSVPRRMVEALDLILLMARLPGKEKSRRVLAEVSEISGVEEKGVRLNPLVKLDPSTRELKWTGVPSSLRDRISRAAGITPTEFSNEVKKRAKLLLKLAEAELEPQELFRRLHEPSEV